MHRQIFLVEQFDISSGIIKGQLLFAEINVSFDNFPTLFGQSYFCYAYCC